MFHPDYSRWPKGTIVRKKHNAENGLVTDSGLKHSNKVNVRFKVPGAIWYYGEHKHKLEIVKLPKWHDGQMVEIVGEPDDSDWSERFGSGKGVIVNSMGINSRWVIVEVLDASWGTPIGSSIRFPKSSLKPIKETK